ncbi:MAG: hypothetical protein V4632_08370 [Pseudomonadota bacterium]
MNRSDVSIKAVVFSCRRTCIEVMHLVEIAQFEGAPHHKGDNNKENIDRRNKEFHDVRSQKKFLSGFTLYAKVMPKD